MDGDAHGLSAVLNAQGFDCVFEDMLCRKPCLSISSDYSGAEFGNDFPSTTDICSGDYAFLEDVNLSDLNYDRKVVILERRCKKEEFGFVLKTTQISSPKCQFVHVISTVVPFSVAYRAELRAGDILAEIDGENLAFLTFDDVAKKLHSTKIRAVIFSKYMQRMRLLEKKKKILLEQLEMKERELDVVSDLLKQYENDNECDVECSVFCTPPNSSSSSSRPVPNSKELLTTNASPKGSQSSEEEELTAAVLHKSNFSNDTTSSVTSCNHSTARTHIIRLDSHQNVEFMNDCSTIREDSDRLSDCVQITHL